MTDLFRILVGPWSLGELLIGLGLLAPQEYQYPAMNEPERYGEVRTFVLLTAYASDDPVIHLAAAWIRRRHSACWRPRVWLIDVRSA